MAIKTRKRTSVLKAAVAGLTLLGAAVVPTAAIADEGHCYGVNKCAGTGACGGPGHSCAGKNGCEAQGYLDIDSETCLKIQGGRLTAEPEEAADESAG